jgi:S1-C subfamily serine protease
MNMVNISWARAVSARRLILLATVANLGIAAVVVGGAFVPAFSKAQAAESPQGSFPPNSQIERFFRGFEPPDAGQENWWQRDWPFPQNSQMEQFLRRFGMPNAAGVTRGWIGVQIQPVTAEIANGLGMKDSDGALVVEPQAGSPAAKAGIMTGDVITAVNGTAVKDARDLARLIGAMAPGTTAKLTVWRKGEEKSVSLTLGEPPKDREARPAASNSSPGDTDIGVTRGWIGVQIQPVTAEIANGLGMKDSDGALVVEPQAGSPAAKAGIMTGDVITAVNGTAVKDARDLARLIGAMAPGTTAKLTVWRKGEEKSVSLTLGEPPKGREARAVSSNSSRTDTDIPELGLMLAPAEQVAGGGSEGLVVTKIDPTGLASEHGVKTGDVIFDIGGNKVAAPEDVRNAISEKNGKRTVLMRLKSDEVMRFVAIPIART